MSFLFGLFLVAIVCELSAQLSLTFRRTISFPASDSAKVRPFLCATDASGNLWVISSRATDTAASNALWRLRPRDTLLTKVVDFTEPRDPIVASLRGVATIGNDVFVTGWQPGVAPQISFLYRYPNGDPARKESFGQNIRGAGYGTYLNGIAATRDTFLFAGITFNTSIRAYNFNRSYAAVAYGSWVPLTVYPLEPGGPHRDGVDVIRDVATIPNGNYADSTTVFYTSRNSSTANPSSGGIALWIRGKQTNPQGYFGKRVTDFFADLALGTFIPYGITVDNAGRLYVAGADSIRRWVKTFAVDTSGTATLLAEFPSRNNPSNPDPAGAPFLAPCDVALSPDNGQAYVIDQFTRKVYVFSTGLTSANRTESLPQSFELYQNFPNPFNPNTTIVFGLPRSEHVTLSVFDLLGREVAHLVDDVLPAGRHQRSFDGSAYRLSSGVYIYRLTFGAQSLSKTMLLLK
jgi:sugar lactone lactonase YvrE